MNPLIRPWRHLFDFSGRATRTEYLLFHVTAFAVVMIIGAVAGVAGALIDGRDRDGPGFALFAVALVIGYGVFLIAHIAIGVRRLHDHNQPGIKYLLTFIPLAGIFFWFMMVLTGGDAFENDYGYDPRQPEPIDREELGGVFS